SVLEITLGRMRLHTQSARSLQHARSHLARDHFDLCLTDLHLPHGSRLELLQHIRRHHPQLPVALLSHEAGAPTSALNGGTCDLLPKPLDLKRLRDWVATALKRQHACAATHASEQLPGDSPPMVMLRRHIAKLAASLAPVYISGES
ncbi:sigma-54-dependent Fis family transcriptional regulator, partial [Pseudomonas sp. MWU12-2534b]